MIVPNTKRHSNNTKTDQLPIFELTTGLPRPYHNISHFSTLETREASLVSAFGTPGTREAPVISDTGTLGAREDSFHLLVPW